ncbi:MAG: hypothetical protein ABJA50_12870 [Chloroflexota bacterium]
MNADIKPNAAGIRMSSKRQVIRAAVIWGVVFGVLQAVSPLMVWWLPPASVYGLSLILIASVYIGIAVADGRLVVIAVECIIVTIFVVVAVAGITGPTWLLVGGLAGHGRKDLWQDRYQFVVGIRWWRPFCSSAAPSTLLWLR